MTSLCCRDCFVDLSSKDLPNTPSYAPTSFLLFSHHSRRSLLLFLSPNSKPLVLGSNYKLRSEAKRSWFVYLSVASHAKQDTVPVQAAKRLCCCIENMMIQDEMGQHLNLCCMQHTTEVNSNVCLTCHSSFLDTVCYFTEGNNSQQKTSQLSSQVLCSSPRGRLLQPSRSINPGTNAHFWRLSTRTWHLSCACLTCSVESVTWRRFWSFAPSAFSKTSKGLHNRDRGLI